MRAPAACGVWLCIAVLLVAGVGGCQRPWVADRSVEIPAPGPAPRYEVLRGVYNARCAKIPRLWARVTVRVISHEEDGSRRVDQGDGVLQIVKPSRVSLSVGKSIDRMYYYLGSDEERFWWVDVMDRDASVALVGTHAGARRERAEEFGVPVHPLDLLELLGITALPEDGGAVVWNGQVGGWMVELPGRWGARRVVVDPVAYLPIAVVLLDADGAAAAGSRLESYARIDESDAPGLHPEMARRVRIGLERLGVEVILDLGAVKSVERLPRDIAFDLDGLLRRERVREVRDLDEPAS